MTIEQHFVATFRNALTAFADAVLPAECAGCRRRGASVCVQCRLDLVAAHRHHRAGRTDGHIPSAVSYEGVVRKLIIGLKYRNARGAAGLLGGLLARELIRDGIRPGADVEVVTWAPTSRSRAKRRGFDQSEIIARTVAAQLGLPVRSLLERVEGDEQKLLTRPERLQAPAFRSTATKWRKVLLIDDVVTTGATLAAASGALRTAGVEHVRCAAVAETPRSRRFEGGCVEPVFAALSTAA